MAYTLPKLDYDYNALEPHIDAKTMEIHHTKHHSAYISNLNNALESEGIEGPKDLNALISDLSKYPESIRTTVRNNGGGHLNHSLFWKMISPNGGGVPLGELEHAIEKSFGGFNSFKELYTKAALTRFGSGWAWLCVKEDGELCVCSTPNQDNPLMKGVAECPAKQVILGLDVWEHAYYLHYQNRRPDYIGAFWKIVDWHAANERFKDALSG